MAFGTVPVVLSKIFGSPFAAEDGGIIPDPGETFFLLLENGSRLLLEDGASRFVKEEAPDV